MNPLVESFANGTVEDELRQLFMRLYGETLAEKAAEINVYGAPHLGPFSLIERNVAADGLVMRRQDDEAGMRYLFKAWRHRNPRRGTHFLSTYLRVLYGQDFEIQQLWQKTDQPYPSALKSHPELVEAGQSESEFFLTSRLRVDLNTDELPSRLVASIKTVVPARFVIYIRLIRRASGETRLANVATMMTSLQGRGIGLSPRSLVINQTRMTGRAAMTSLLLATGALRQDSPAASDAMGIASRVTTSTVFTARLES